MRVIFAALLLSSASAAPCDTFASSGTPCVAAHSVVRALFSTYQGPLYSVKRADGATTTIGVTSGGVANARAQDAFCQSSSCIIERIFDQSPKGNHLDLGPGGGAAPKPDLGVNASAAPTTLGGNAVYGAFFAGGEGYRIENTTGVATGDEPETMYMVVSGRHFNDRCCFDYGNAETDARDHGKGTMEAVYWGNATGWGRGADSGPWVMAVRGGCAALTPGTLLTHFFAQDLENGLWAGSAQTNPGNKPIDADFVVAMVKGKSGSPGGFTLKGGDATQGGLATLYDGVRPPDYTPMKKQGSIILGTGGDNSNWAVGTWYEGVMTSGYSTDAADAAVYSNIMAAGYGK